MTLRPILAWLGKGLGVAVVSHGGGWEQGFKVSFALFAWASSTYIGFRSRKNPFGIAGFRNFQVFFFFFFAIIEGGL